MIAHEFGSWLRYRVCISHYVTIYHNLVLVLVVVVVVVVDVVLVVVHRP